MTSNVRDTNTSVNSVLVNTPIAWGNDYVYFKVSDYVYVVAQGDLEASGTTIYSVDPVSITRYTRYSYVDGSYNRYAYRIDTYSDKVNVNTTLGICPNNVIDGFPRLGGEQSVQASYICTFAVVVLFIYLVCKHLFDGIRRLGR